MQHVFLHSFDSSSTPFFRTSFSRRWVMMRIGIGISTYNDFVNTNKLINSIRMHTLGEYSLVVVDDGTRDEKMVSALEKVCDNHGVLFRHNPENRGIPYTWNRLTELCTRDPEDIVVLFNNDILVINENWLRCIEYFLTKNEKIGTVGFPLIYPQDEKRTEKERFWDEKPGHVGAAVGCCFGFKRGVWEQVRNPDGSIGLWEDLVSFHEETHLGFRLSELGYYNYMLPWPPMVHFGGQTFDKNRELWERQVDWSKWEKLDKQEYIEAIKKSKVYPEEWKENKIVWINNQVEMVDRMAFSRYMFAKYWDVLYAYDAPQVEVHKRIVTPMPRRKIRWLDMDLKEREAEA